MDDSERSYGYSQDIYHGKRGAGGHYDRTNEDAGRSPDPERSYEYGPEAGMGDTEDVEVSPEEAAIHVEDDGLRRSSGGAERGGEESQYDYGREGGGSSAQVDSFTWEAEPDADRATPVPETAEKR
jgi:hypothetical protein